MKELSPVFLKKKKKLEYNHDRSFVYIAAFTQIIELQSRLWPIMMFKIFNV